MTLLSRNATALAAGLYLALSGMSFAAQVSTVNVTLWDKGPDSATPNDAMPMGMGSPGANMAMAPLGLKLNATSVRAGKVTFAATNASKDIVHEMILSPLPADGKPLPYLAADYKVNEEAAGYLGEVSELDPGKSGALTVDLKPGKYIVYCNIPAHFMNGMWTIVTVTK